MPAEALPEQSPPLTCAGSFFRPAVHQGASPIQSLLTDDGTLSQSSSFSLPWLGPGHMVTAPNQNYVLLPSKSQRL